MRSVLRVAPAWRRARSIVIAVGLGALGIAPACSGSGSGGDAGKASGSASSKTREGQGAQDDPAAGAQASAAPAHHGKGLAAHVQAARDRAEHPPKPTGEGSPDLRRIETRAELAEVFAEAARHDRYVLIDVSAVWCLPCKELEVMTLGDEAVRALIAERFVGVRIDVTDGDAVDEEIQTLLDARTLPALRVYEPSATVVAMVDAGDEPLPAAKLRVDTFIEPEELLGQLRKATG